MNKRNYVLAAVFSLLAAFSVFAQYNRNAVTPPNWAIGTWYGTTSYGPRIIITIARNGTVTSQIENNTAYGVYQRGDMAVFDTVSVSVTRAGKGIETYNAASGERVVYSRRGFDDNGNTRPIYNGGNNYPIYNDGGGHDADGLGQPGVMVYEDRDGRGRSQSFGYGRYLSAGNTFGNLRNDKASSVQVSGGYHVRLCESEGDGAGGGQCEDYGPGMFNLRLNDKASFIEVTRTGIWGGNGNGYPNGYPNNNPNNYPAPGYPGGSGAVYINDLAGQKTGTADSQMRNRGFQQVDSYRQGGTDFRIWWRSLSRQCIEVGLGHGRYSTITDIGSHPGCQ